MASRSGPRTRTSGSNGSTPSPSHAVLSFRVAAAGTGCALLPLDALAAPGDRGRPGLRRTARSTSPHNRRLRRRPRSRSATSPTCSRRSGRTSTSAPADAPSGTGRRRPDTTRTRYLCESACLPRPGRHPGAGDAGAAPGHPARRHRARAALRLRRLRVHLSSRSGTRPCRACSTAASSSSHAHVRGGGEGGRRWWLDGRLAHKQNTFTDHLAVADGLARGLVDGDRIATPRAERRRPAPGRGAQPAPGPVAGRGRGGAVRRRGHHDVRRVHPADGHRVGRVGRPAAPGGVRLAARLLAVRQPAAGRRAGPTCWSPAPCTTRGSWSASRPSGWRRCARPTRSGRRAACSASRPAPAPTPGPSGRYAHLAYEAEVYAWLLDRLGGRLTRRVSKRLTSVLTDDQDDAVPPAAQRAQHPGALHALAGTPVARCATPTRPSTSTSRCATPSASSTPPRCSSTASTGPTPSGSWPACWSATSARCRPGQAQYTLWCDDRGFVMEDGVVFRHSETRLPADRGPAEPRLVQPTCAAGCGSRSRTSPTTTASSRSRVRGRAPCCRR